MQTIYQQFFNVLQIQEKDTIWLSSEILKLPYIFRKFGETFDAKRLIEELKDRVGKEGTLLFPTFCFDFSNTGKYDYIRSKGNSGVLGNIALTDCGFLRTKHPLHSFAVWGKDAELLFDMENRHSFGTDSPFAYCREKNVKQIMLGTDYVHAMTFVHYVETVCEVPYRFPKTFTGIYVTSEGIEEIREYDYAARKLDVGTKEKFNRIGKILEEEKIAQEIDFHGCMNHFVLLGDSFCIIQDDILHNQCRNIYDFDIPREEIFKQIY